MSAPPFEPDRFRSTVDFYVRYRLPYPIELLEMVRTQLGLRAGAHVLDLGCGPGSLANLFAHLGCQVVAIDPSTDMLTAGRAAAAKAGVAVDYRLGSSLDLDGLADRFDLVAMGRAFHWMERAPTLSSLDRLIAPDGAVVLFYDSHIRSAENAAITAADKVRERYGRAAQRKGAHKPALLVPDESVLLDSAFCRLTRLGLIERRPVDVDTIVGRSLSTSFTSPEKLGERQAAFEAELLERLFALKSDGQLTELVEFTALICERRQ